MRSGRASGLRRYTIEFVFCTFLALGFAGLMITTILSYLSHSQIWGLQCGRDLHLGGKSNRLGVLFDQELSTIIDSVPDAGPEGR